MQRLFVDTSAWFAYANAKDPAHVAVLKTIQTFRGRLTTSNFVFDETVTLCRYRLGHDSAARFGDALLMPATVDLIRVTPADEQAAWALFCQRPDQGYSFTDCTSFVLMRRLEIVTALALDEDFRSEGFQTVP
jgi:uncharacterized protein